jgi:hypothetical protein
MIENFEHTPQQVWMTGIATDIAQELRESGVISNRSRERIAAVLQSMYNNGAADALARIQTTMFELPTEIMVPIPPPVDNSE